MGRSAGCIGGSLHRRKKRGIGTGTDSGGGVELLRPESRSRVEGWASQMWTAQKELPVMMRLGGDMHRYGSYWIGIRQRGWISLLVIFTWP